MIDCPRTRTHDEQVLHILEYLSSDSIWYVNNSFKLVIVLADFFNHVPFSVVDSLLQKISNNLLLTEHEGCTAENWPKGIAVWTECSEVCTKSD